MIKKVILHDKERVKSFGVEDSFTFSQLMVQEIERQDSLESLLSCNRGAFVLVFMLETEIDQVTSKLRDMLKKNEKLLKKFKSKGIEILSKKIT